MSATCLGCDEQKVDEDCHVIIIAIKAIYLGVCGAARFIMSVFPCVCMCVLVKSSVKWKLIGLFFAMRIVSLFRPPRV